MVLDQSRSSKPRPISAEVGGGKVGIEAGGLGLFFADELWEDDLPFNDPIDRNPFRRFPEPVVLGERSSFGDCICGLVAPFKRPKNPFDGLREVLACCCALRLSLTVRLRVEPSLLLPRVLLLSNLPSKSLRSS